MNYKVSLLLDRTIGHLIVQTLKLFKKDHINSPPEKYKKIAVLKFAEMGGTVHFLPYLDAMANKVGEQNVFFICFKGHKEIIEVMKNIPNENIVEIRHSNLLFLVIDIIRLYRYLLKNKVDLIIDLNLFSNLGRIICFFGKSMKSVGMGDSENKNLYSFQVPYQKKICHITEIYNRYTEFLDLDLKLKLSSFYERNQHTNESSHLKIAINMNIHDMLPLRKWPKEYYIELIKHITMKYKNVEIYIIGTKEDRNDLDLIISDLNLPNVINKAGDTRSLNELFLFLEEMNLLISSDSGPIHFSTMVKNLKLVALFGPESPQRFSSRNTNSIELYQDIHCSPCFSQENRCISPCRDNVCMKLIKPSDVLIAVNTLLQS